MKDVLLDVFFPGFPTLAHIPHEAHLKVAGVKVFEQASRGENMILKLKDQGRPVSTEEVAQELLNQEIWVSWPHMVEAKVYEVWDQKAKFFLGNNGQLKSAGLDEGSKSKYALEIRTITEK